MMSNWFDFTFLDQTLGLLDEDLLQVFNLKAEYVQFSLVLLLVTSLMWVVRPVIEWIMLNHWSTMASYTTSVLLALAFLQLVDRYAMVQKESMLPEYYWPLCLLAISSYGVLYSLFKVIKKTWVHFSKRSKKRAA
ncbi:hypothetical protein [Halobacillus mangrovi]|nr:hypothetical protein [Halobacillus mangrovi]